VLYPRALILVTSSDPNNVDDPIFDILCHAHIFVVGGDRDFKFGS